MSKTITLNSAVHDLYRAILGRSPESDAVVVEHAERGTVEAVATALPASDEHRRPPERPLRLCNCYDFEIYVPEGDWMLDGIASSGSYEPWVIEAFREQSTGKRVLDVGANIGIFSITASKVTNKPIIAVEASPENAKLIAINAAHNGAPNVKIIPAAAAADFGMAKFCRTLDSNKVTREFALNAETFPTIDVAAAMPLDVLVRDPIDVFKIDIEGYEWNALQGATEIMTAKPIMFLEFSPDFMRDGAGVEPGTFLNFFFDRGYQASILHRDMTREPVGEDGGRLLTAWQEYMSRHVTHLDLMLEAHR